MTSAVTVTVPATKPMRMRRHQKFAIVANNRDNSHGGMYFITMCVLRYTTHMSETFGIKYRRRRRLAEKINSQELVNNARQKKYVEISAETCRASDILCVFYVYSEK